MTKSYGYEVHLNDKFVCRAGFDNDNHVSTVILTSVRKKGEPEQDMFLQASGMNSDTAQHVDWANEKLKIGDRITIQIVSDRFHSPSSLKEKQSPEEILEGKMKYYHKLKEELKDHLAE